MTFRLSACLSALGLVIVACHEVQSPVEPASLSPRTRLSVSGPDAASQVPLSATPLTTIGLPNYLYPTWVETRIDGSITLTSLPGSYTPAGPVYAAGVSGYGGTCSMGMSFFFPGTYNLAPGPCSAVLNPRVDTVQAAGAATAKRADRPLEFYCGQGVPTNQCHAWSGEQHVSVTPLRVTLDSVKPRPRTVQFTGNQVQVVFTGYITPATIRVQGNTITTPRNNTLWSYIDGDGTPESNSCTLGINGTAATCSPFLSAAGRMTLKSYVGGWEQTATVTVQCLTPGDPALNDSITDFSVRADLLNVLAMSNPDSSPGAGRNENNPRGSRHESGGVVWQLPNGGGFMFVPWDDPFSTQGSYNLPDSEWDPTSAPVPGATPYAAVHSHPNNPGNVLYTSDKDSTYLVDGSHVPYSRWPGDTLDNGNPRPVAHKAFENPYNAGSDADQRNVVRRNLPTFIVSTDSVGYVFRLNVPPPSGASTSTPFRKNGGTTAERKCAWPKKYQS